MKKLDLKKEFKHLYDPSAKKVVTVEVPRFNFLMIDGKGDPNNSKEFMDATEALFNISYTLKFMFKFEKGIDYPVMALEGLWWMHDDSLFDMNKKDAWRWTLMMMQPTVVTKSLVEQTIKKLQVKKDLPAFSHVYFESFDEGLSAQTMHIGPYSEETPTIEKVHAYIKEQGFEIHGRHHEIYKSDPRRTKPEKMKTVIRYPIKKVK
ncbi:MAG: GyrI-like domain-containing protein [Ignavibacteriales bacterium]|nr:GyrI-like domain-containing protein [Ignavibacteriales bacterium]